MCACVRGIFLHYLNGELFGSEPPLNLASLTCQVVEDTKL